MIITIDGPAGAGKSTVAQKVASELGFEYLDTGAMYRAVAWMGLEKKVNWDQPEELTELAKKLEFQADGGKTIVSGVDVTDLVRSQEVTAHTRFAANNPDIRTLLVRWQRSLTEGRNIVTEGRDQGSAVFPDAEYKFYLDATVEERARRRMEEFRQRGESLQESDFSDIMEQISLRDRQDSQRTVGPLKVPENAIRIDTDGMNADAVTARIISYILKPH